MATVDDLTGMGHNVVVVQESPRRYQFRNTAGHTKWGRINSFHFWSQPKNSTNTQESILGESRKVHVTIAHV
jgi:hypothetical protein